MRILVCGGRNYNNPKKVMEVLDKLYRKNDIEMIINGGGSGADTLAKNWAEIRRIPYLTVPADWGIGKVAGPLRNTKMLELGQPDLVVAFPGGKGTANMVIQSRKSNIKVQEINE